MNKLIKCPICKKTYLTTGIRNHIIGTSINEISRITRSLMNESGLTISKSKIIIKSPHYKFIRDNTKEVKTIKLQLKI